MGKIIFFSGAGLDAPSGIRTFRDANGLWNDHKIEDVCTESTWIKNYDLVHDFYNERRRQLKEVEPNIAHKVLKEIQDEYNDVIHLTMNVSDLLDREGVDNIKLHGNLREIICPKCFHKFDIGYEAYNLESKCENCNGYKALKPNIVFFGGEAPNYMKLYNVVENIQKDDIVVVIGTMGNVVDVQSLFGMKNCYKILCNMEKSEYILDGCFNEVYYESIETAILKIRDSIKKIKE